jgi:peptidoglycan/xylan/chitin deacetylase (PgdA/CDA1 family)
VNQNKNRYRSLKKNGCLEFVDLFKEIYARSRSKLLDKSRIEHEAPGFQYDFEEIVKLDQIEYLEVPNIHSEKTIDTVMRFSPDLGIALSAPILKERLFSIPHKGTINLHKGKLPDYRGMPPAFWEMWNSEKSVGCTVHKVEAGLDTGDILLESKVGVAPHSTVKGLQLCLDEVGVNLVKDAVALLLRGEEVWTEQPSGGHTYKKPTLRQERALNKKINSRKNDLRFYLKELFFALYVYCYAPIRCAFPTEGKVIVLLYHRVNDDCRDDVTVGIEQFNRQMKFLAESRYYVAKIDDVLTGNVDTRKNKRIIVVTFDDGYEDNFKNAVPILLRNKIDASFFISTNIVGSKARFAHDLKNGLDHIPNLSWDQIMVMRDLGFTIGSHTENHINCAKADSTKVKSEIIASRSTLAEKLDLHDCIFAYPHGKKDDITPKVLDFVKEQGFLGCLSAYGGVNTLPLDPYNVKRMGIDWKFSSLAFRARLKGFSR